MKKVILITLLCSSIFSCGKKEKTKDNNEVVKQEEDFLQDEENIIPNDPAIFEAIVSSKNEISVWNHPSIDSLKIGTLVPKEKVQVTLQTGKFEKIPLDTIQNTYGQWLKINYALPNSISNISGYIFDSFVNYDQKEKQTNAQAYVSIKNEWEFLDALSSNKVILIETDTLNFDHYYKEFSGSEDFNKDAAIGHYTFSESGSLQLHDYKNLTLRSVGKQVLFIAKKIHKNLFSCTNCTNFTVDGFNFQHKKGNKNSQQGFILTLQECKNTTFMNTEFDGSGALGALVTNSNNIKFYKSKFYNTSGDVITIHNSNGVMVENSMLYENDHGTLVKLQQENILEEQNTLQPIQFHNSAFLHNNATAILGIKKPKGTPINSVLKFSDCKIQNNTLLSFINFEKPNNNLGISFQNCEIINNDGADQDFIFISRSGNSDIISFINTNIKNNKDNFEIDLSKITLKNTSINDNLYQNEDTPNGNEQ
ncbi:hypothetical protein [Aquimarina aquimarini]|uniref:hypothetical protein n=1 Tax=Aquimarina aquimarini TaxID=1191734 RepID=UPI000D55B7E7|nr:hypothetical protein [Aquimarina aquimarini]